jgi:hypothetical protein
VPMNSDISEVLYELAKSPPRPTLDVFGATVEFVSWSDEFCVMRGVVPPGGVVPLHRHPDPLDIRQFTTRRGRSRSGVISAPAARASTSALA